jgi:hypothetical protein
MELVQVYVNMDFGVGSAEPLDYATTELVL